jgi:ribosome-associated protein YbcJ (S4-like RNA binding protein)
VRGLIGSAAEAKMFLATEAVWVNGRLEARRGRKLRADDVARVGEVELRVISDERRGSYVDTAGEVP